MTIHSITLNIMDSSHVGGNATVALYMHDKGMMDVGATLVSQIQVQVPPTEPITEILEVDVTNLEQNGRGWDEMTEPSMYVALLVDQSELGYSSAGPLFNVSPGDTADFVLASKN